MKTTYLMLLILAGAAFNGMAQLPDNAISWDQLQKTIDDHPFGDATDAIATDRFAKAPSTATMKTVELVWLLDSTYYYSWENENWEFKPTL